MKSPLINSYCNLRSANVSTCLKTSFTIKAGISTVTDKFCLFLKSTLHPQMQISYIWALGRWPSIFWWTRWRRENLNPKNANQWMEVSSGLGWRNGGLSSLIEAPKWRDTVNILDDRYQVISSDLRDESNTTGWNLKRSVPDFAVQPQKPTL